MKITVLITILIFALVSCGKTVKKDENTLKNKKSILYSLPENTQFILNLKSINSIFKNFKLSKNSRFGNLLKDEQIKLVKDILDINPLNIKELKDIGLDLNKNFGFVVNDMSIKKDRDLSSVNTITYFPIKNKLKTSKYIDSLLLKYPNEHKKFSIIKEASNKYFKLWDKKNNKVFYFFVENDHLFVIHNPFSSKDSLKVTKVIIEKLDKFEEAELFDKEFDFSSINDGIYFYFNLNNFIKGLNDAPIDSVFQNSVEEFKAYKTYAGVVTLDSKDFNLDFNIKFNENLSDFKEYLINKKSNTSSILNLDKTVISLISIFISNNDFIFEVMTQALLEGKHAIDIKKIISDIDNMLKINLKKDIWDNLAGDILYASYDGASIGATIYNTVFSISFKEPKLVESLIDKVLSNEDLAGLKNIFSKTKYKENNVYILNYGVLQAYIGFKGNELIIASSKNMYDKAMDSKKGKGFYKEIKKDKILSSGLKSGFFIYLSSPEIIKALNNFKMMIPKDEFNNIVEILEKINYTMLSNSLDFDENSLKAKYVLDMKTKSVFFITLIDYINKMEAKATGEAQKIENK